jgi:hypothetical protein
MPITSAEATALTTLIETAMSLPDPKLMLPAIKATIAALAAASTPSPTIEVVGQIKSKASSVPSSPLPAPVPAPTPTPTPTPVLARPPVPAERKSSSPPTAATLAAGITEDIPRPKQTKKMMKWADVKDMDPSPYIYTDDDKSQ